jgi:hypothetical protein
MGRAQAAAADWLPGTAQEVEAVRGQLHRILDNHLFHNSKRYPNLLRHIVERTLEGHSDDLKERVLGIEVFGRDPNYDTNADPIVRVTAGEIRKRIAQYYHEPGHESELRIDLDPGSYVPKFHLANGTVPAEANDFSPAFPPIAPGSPTMVRSRLWLYAALACVLAAVSIAAILTKPWSARTALEQFWEPILESSGPVLFTIGEPPQVGAKGGESGGNSNLQETISEHIRRADHIVLPDANALLNLSRFIGRAGRAYHLQGTTAATLTDLRQGPAVLISGFDNQWTLRLTEPLRFHFVHEPGSSIFSIQDRDHPDTQWSVDFGRPYSTLTEDYAVVARFPDATTGQMVVVAAGVGSNGTISAGEFLTDRTFLEQISAQAPRDWTRKNMEAVIATQVIDGKSGPPRLAAVHFW